MEIIKSLDNKKIKYYSKLLNKKNRDEEGLFLIEGEHLVLEALKSGYLKEVIQTEDYDKNFDVPTTYVTYEVLKKLSNVKTPQKIIGVCKKILEKDIGNKVLILDDIQDPGNLGTIIRSCVAFDIDTICLSLNTVDMYNDKVIRSSEGMFFHLNIIRKELTSFINALKKEDYLIYGTNVLGGKDVREVKTSNKWALIMGNEGAGVSKSVLALCDEYLYIPMNDLCESLNVGVATSIILFEINKKV